MHEQSIKQIVLRNFKIHQNLQLDVDDKSHVAIVGQNGLGKTAILEAISMMAPGRGLLSSDNEMLIRHGEVGAHVSITTDTVFKFDLSVEKRSNGIFSKKININDKAITKHTNLLHWCNILWLTAEMQYILSSSSSKRRKFFDRLTFYVKNEHGSLYTNYEKLLHRRLMHLNSAVDVKFIDAIERQIALHMISIATNRIDMLKMLQSGLEYSHNIDLPLVGIDLSNSVESYVQNNNSDAVENILIEKLRVNRAHDTKSLRTSYGVHKTEFMPYSDNTNIAIMSSGEQKMTLIAILCAAAYMMNQALNKKPIILLDDVFSFLDMENTNKILNSIDGLGSQIWLTSATHDVPIRPNLQIYNL